MSAGVKTGGRWARLRGCPDLRVCTCALICAFNRECGRVRFHFHANIPPRLCTFRCVIPLLVRSWVLLGSVLGAVWFCKLGRLAYCGVLVEGAYWCGTGHEARVTGAGGARSLGRRPTQFHTDDGPHSRSHGRHDGQNECPER